MLKAPQVANHLEAFSAVFPEARFLATVRDPYRVFASGRALVSGVVDAFATEDFEPPDPLPIETVERVLQSLIDFHAASPELISTVDYPTLVADPSAVARSCYTELVLPADLHLTSSIERFLNAQRSGARVRPPSTLPEPGISHEAILARPTVAAFCERFSVDPEHTRLTGAHP